MAAIKLTTITLHLNPIIDERLFSWQQKDAAALPSWQK